MSPATTSESDCENMANGNGSDATDNFGEIPHTSSMSATAGESVTLSPHKRRSMRLSEASMSARLLETRRSTQLSETRPSTRLSEANGAAQPPKTKSSGSKRQRKSDGTKETENTTPQTPEEMYRDWISDNTDFAPDPALERSSYAGMKKRATKVIDKSGLVLGLQFYLLQEHPAFGFWVLQDNAGRRQIVRRRPLRAKLVFPSTEDDQDDQDATSGFYEWLGDEKFAKDPSGYIVSEVLNGARLSVDELNQLPNLVPASTSSLLRSSSNTGSSLRSPLAKKQKHDKNSAVEPSLRRSNRDRMGPCSYRITAKSFDLPTDESPSANLTTTA
jgi:hypothetical protein